MNATLRIGDQTRNLADADERWINDQIRRRREDQSSICVQLSLDYGQIHLLLSTPGCGGGGGGSRPLTAGEREVLELWNKLGLNTGDFAGGNVVAMVKQVMRFLP